MIMLQRWIGSLVLLSHLFFSVGFAANINTLECKQRHCLAVVDAGSTASRLYVYAYDLNEQKTPIHIEPIYENKIAPGLATMSRDKVSIDTYLSALMSAVSQHPIPVYFYATAGMRLLPTTLQDHYYADITTWFSTHPHWQLKEARTISGEEEGLYGWLGLNYHLHTLEDASQPLVGLLEIGGASAQIAFPVQDVEAIDSKNIRHIQVYGRPITLFTYSFLGLGVNELFAQSKGRSACFPIGYPLDNGELASGDANSCQKELGQMMNDSYQVKALTQAALDKRSNQEWYTVAAVSKMILQKPFVFSGRAFTLVDLLQQTDQRLCHQEYSYLTKHYSHNEFILKNCLIGSYFYGLLVQSYGFDGQQSVGYLPDSDVSWTVGALLLL
ncbi:MAG: multidrug DMT transporter permease [Legionella sp.]|nr:MAG: multidrug DMT transporter permease [Legionella sp.]